MTLGSAMLPTPFLILRLISLTLSAAAEIFRNHALQLPNDTFLAVTSISYLPLAETLRSHTSVISFAMSSYKGRLA